MNVTAQYSSIKFGKFKKAFNDKFRYKMKSNCHTIGFIKLQRVVGQCVWYSVADLTCEVANRAVIEGKNEECRESVLKELMK